MFSLRDATVIKILILAIVWPASSRVAEAGTSDAELRDELSSSHREWQENDSKFRSMRKSDATSSEMVDEFAEFVASLRRKMLENCQALRRAGLAPESLVFECGLPKERRSPEEAMDKDPKSIETKEEQTAALEERLSQSLTEFDRQIQGRQDQSRAILGKHGGASYPPAGNQVKGSRRTDATMRGSAGGQQELHKPKNEPQKPPPLADPGAGPGAARTAVLRSSGELPAGGNDDDVVASQLREAAEKEQDPLLKEKLWDEYRKYRAN